MLNKAKKKKQKMRKRTKFTIFAVFNLVWYTITVLILSAYGRPVPSELTISWFSAWTVELGLLFGIKLKESPKDMYTGPTGYTIPSTNVNTNDFNEVQDPNELNSVSGGVG